jgi:ABC-2 type transport system permease protein
VTWIAVIAGLSAKTTDGAGAFSYPIVFLPFISSAIWIALGWCAGLLVVAYALAMVSYHRKIA